MELNINFTKWLEGSNVGSVHNFGADWNSFTAIGGIAVKLFYRYLLSLEFELLALAIL